MEPWQNRRVAASEACNLPRVTSHLISKLDREYIILCHTSYGILQPVALGHSNFITLITTPASSHATSLYIGVIAQLLQSNATLKQ